LQRTPARSVAGSADAHFHTAPSRQTVAVKARAGALFSMRSTEKTISLQENASEPIARTTTTSPCSLSSIGTS
jgi:hypothetical protein